MNGSFRRQCAAALTHPVTLAAIGVLLLNDIVLKSLWPDAWVTGKLSDLAWVVFASPLLAFLLSLVVGSGRVGQRAVFLSAYAGLPLLYAAFNTFEPVHHWILRGISLVSGGTAGSPLDLTDSLVIPLGLGVALWVWRGSELSAASLRLRFGLLVAAVGALASVATSYPEPDFGIVRLGSSEDGFIYASSYEGYGPRVSYRSGDGGLTWNSDTELTELELIRWGGNNVETPEGRFSIGGAEIVLTNDYGELEVVYSARHLRKEGNVWVQERATSDLGPREVATAPFAIVFDEASGNLVTAMGIQGVVVRRPDGEWTPLPVGEYSPADFSFWGKTRILLSNGEFWAMVLALSLCATGASLFAWRDHQQRHDVGLVVTVSALVACCFLLYTFGGSDSDPGEQPMVLHSSRSPWAHTFWAP